MMKNCGRCERPVYPTEELKCLDKVWHRTCFKCQSCNMTLNMKTYKGYEKLPYCEAHIPKAKATTVSETPELRRIAENTKLQSQVRYHEDFEKAKGKFTQVADDPETLRIKANTKIISNVAYHGDLEKKAIMEQKRSLTGGDDPGMRLLLRYRYRDLSKIGNPRPPSVPAPAIAKTKPRIEPPERGDIEPLDIGDEPIGLDYESLKRNVIRVEKEREAIVGGSVKGTIDRLRSKKNSSTESATGSGKNRKKQNIGEVLGDIVGVPVKKAVQESASVESEVEKEIRVAGERRVRKEERPKVKTSFGEVDPGFFDRLANYQNAMQNKTRLKAVYGLRKYKELFGEETSVDGEQVIQNDSRAKDAHCAVKTGRKKNGKGSDGKESDVNGIPDGEEKKANRKIRKSRKQSDTNAQNSHNVDKIGVRLTNGSSARGSKGSSITGTKIEKKPMGKPACYASAVVVDRKVKVPAQNGVAGSAGNSRAISNGELRSRSSSSDSDSFTDTAYDSWPEDDPSGSDRKKIGHSKPKHANKKIRSYDSPSDDEFDGIQGANGMTLAQRSGRSGSILQDEETVAVSVAGKLKELLDSPKFSQQIDDLFLDSYANRRAMIFDYEKRTIRKPKYFHETVFEMLKNYPELASALEIEDIFGKFDWDSFFQLPFEGRILFKGIMTRLESTPSEEQKRVIRKIYRSKSDNTLLDTLSAKSSIIKLSHRHKTTWYSENDLSLEDFTENIYQDFKKCKMEMDEKFKMALTGYDFDENNSDPSIDNFVNVNRCECCYRDVMRYCNGNEDLLPLLLSCFGSHDSHIIWSV